MSATDGQEHIASSSSNNNPSNGVQSPRNTPHCGKCRNHGILVPLRGHKRKCIHRDCECRQCILTVRRREVMAAQNVLIRQKKMEEKMHVQTSPLMEREPSLPSPIMSPPIPRVSPSVSPPTSSPSPPRVGNVTEEHSYAVMKLIRYFGLEMNALPFAYAVLRIAGDIQVAIDMVKKAQKEFLPRTSYSTVPISHNPLDIEPEAGPSLYRSFESNEPLRLVMEPSRGTRIPRMDSHFRSFGHSSLSLSPTRSDRFYSRPSGSPDST